MLGGDGKTFSSELHLCFLVSKLNQLFDYVIPNMVIQRC